MHLSTKCIFDRPKQFRFVPQTICKLFIDLSTLHPASSAQYANCRVASDHHQWIQCLWGSDLSLKREVSCKYMGMCKLPQLENYELSLMQKMKLSAGFFALNVMILVVSKSIFWHLADSTSPDSTDRCCGAYRIFSWHLWIFVDPFWVSFWKNDILSDTLDLYVILVQMGFFDNKYQTGYNGIQRLFELHGHVSKWILLIFRVCQMTRVYFFSIILIMGSITFSSFWLFVIVHHALQCALQWCYCRSFQ